MGYGHDDKVCAYPSLAALLNADNLDKTGVCVLVDKEEIGSVGATGMHSRFFENMTAEVMERMGQYSELKLRRALTASICSHLMSMRHLTRTTQVSAKRKIRPSSEMAWSL